MRIFLDTNVLASSIATRGLCNEVLEIVMHDHDLLTCEPLFAELKRMLTSKLRIPRPIVADFVALLRREGELIEAQSAPSVDIEDADDIPLLACALSGDADLFVTGDKALLELHEIDGMRVISPREFWMRLASGR